MYVSVSKAISSHEVLKPEFHMHLLPLSQNHWVNHPNDTRRRIRTNKHAYKQHSQRGDVLAGQCFARTIPCPWATHYHKLKRTSTPVV